MRGARLTLHLIPKEDAGEHQASKDCWCLPTVEVTARPDGVFGRLVEHRREAAVEEIADLRSNDD